MIMELVKTSEDFRRSYDEVGQSSDIINSVQYSLKDGDVQVGNINVYKGGYSINVMYNNKDVTTLVNEISTMIAATQVVE
jgi:hypothetical protein